MTSQTERRRRERREFLERIIQAIPAEEKGISHPLEVKFALAVSIHSYLARNREGIVTVISSSMRSDSLFAKLYAKIKEFARTPEEEGALIADLLEWVTSAITDYFRQPLKAQEGVE